MNSLNDYYDEIKKNDAFLHPYRQASFYSVVGHLRNPIPRYTLQGQECLTLCAAPGQDVIHPETGEMITDTNSSFCVTKPWLSHEGNIKNTGQCFMPNHEVVNSLFVPVRTRDCRMMLADYPQIRDWGSALAWARSAIHTPPVFVRQLLNCASRVYKIEPERKKMYKERQMSHLLSKVQLRLKDWFPGERIDVQIKDVEIVTNQYVKEYNLDWLSLHLDEGELMRRIKMRLHDNKNMSTM